MPQWYCHVGGQTYGPVEDEGVRAWIAEGRVGPSDLLWNPDMPQWAPAGSVPGFFAPGQAAPMPPPSGLVGSVQVRPPYGTGGMTPNSQLNGGARAILAGRWGLPIGFSLLLVLLSLVASGPPYLGPIISLIVSGPLALGGAIFYLTFARGGRAGLEMLFAGFKNFGDALGAYIVVALLVVLWMAGPMVAGAAIGALLGVVVGALAGAAGQGALMGLAIGAGVGAIPGWVLGILAQLSYSQTFYVLADDPAAGPMEAVRRSKRMMTHRRLKLFCLQLRYFCWSLLCLLTCGVGFLWLMPYVGVGLARFYDDLHPPAESGEMAQPSQWPAGTAPA